MDTILRQRLQIDADVNVKNILTNNAKMGGSIMSDLFSTTGKMFQSSIMGIGQVSTSIYRLRRAFDELIEPIDAITAKMSRLRATGDVTANNNVLHSAITRSANDARVDFNDFADIIARVRFIKGDMSIGQASSFASVLSKASYLGGSSKEESQRSLNQLMQAISSGILGGDELKSIRENAPGLTKYLTLGLNRLYEKDNELYNKFKDAQVGDLKGLGAKGLLTSDVVINAFNEVREDIAQDFKNLDMTIGQKVGIISNNVSDVMYNGGYIKTFEPIMDVLNDLYSYADLDNPDFTNLVDAISNIGQYTANTILPPLESLVGFTGKIVNFVSKNNIAGGVAKFGISTAITAPIVSKLLSITSSAFNKASELVNIGAYKSDSDNMYKLLKEIKAYNGDHGRISPSTKSMLESMSITTNEASRIMTQVTGSQNVLSSILSNVSGILANPMFGVGATAVIGAINALNADTASRYQTMSKWGLSSKTTLEAIEANSSGILRKLLFGEDEVGYKDIGGKPSHFSQAYIKGTDYAGNIPTEASNMGFTQRGSVTFFPDNAIMLDKNKLLQYEELVNTIAKDDKLLSWFLDANGGENKKYMGSLFGLNEDGTMNPVLKTKFFDDYLNDYENTPEGKLISRTGQSKDSIIIVRKEMTDMLKALKDFYNDGTVVAAMKIKEDWDNSMISAKSFAVANGNEVVDENQQYLLKDPNQLGQYVTQQQFKHMESWYRSFKKDKDSINKLASLNPDLAKFYGIKDGQFDASNMENIFAPYENKYINNPVAKEQIPLTGDLAKLFNIYKQNYGILKTDSDVNRANTLSKTFAPEEEPNLEVSNMVTKKMLTSVMKQFNEFGKNADAMQKLAEYDSDLTDWLWGFDGSKDSIKNVHPESTLNNLIESINNGTKTSDVKNANGEKLYTLTETQNTYLNSMICILAQINGGILDILGESDAKKLKKMQDGLYSLFEDSKSVGKDVKDIKETVQTNYNKQKIDYLKYVTGWYNDRQSQRSLSIGDVAVTVTQPINSSVDLANGLADALIVELDNNVFVA